MLALLRAAVIVLVILAMLRPTLIYTQTKKQAATLVVLADQSRSMSVPDAVGDKTRWEALRQARRRRRAGVGQAAARFRAEGLRLRRRSFTNVPSSSGKIELPDKPEGQQTAIGAALEDVLRREAGKRLLGVVLLSDGAQRAYAPRDLPPQTAAARLKHLGYPLFTFPFGQSRGLGEAQDVAVKDLVVNPTVFVKNELTISGQVRVDGYVNRRYPGPRALRDRAGQDGSRRPADDQAPRPTASSCRSSSATSRRRPANTSSRSKRSSSRANW